MVAGKIACWGLHNMALEANLPPPSVMEHDNASDNVGAASNQMDGVNTLLDLEIGMRIICALSLFQLNKWGFKHFVRAGMSGIVYDFLLYGGEDTIRYIQFSQAEETLTLGTKVVVALCKTIQTRACVVYFDNYFSTLDLAIYLRDECGIFSLGTICQNRLKGCNKLLMSDKSLKRKYQ
ncbi:hypothetical protein SFRURICE_010705 [Spodoptera frugiperda]|nr:hypothetical protein SFRURICE_010705 [Spodoptera frugiperda]